MDSGPTTQDAKGTASNPVDIFKEKLRQKFKVDDLIDQGIAMWEEDCLDPLAILLDAQLDTCAELLKQDFFEMKFAVSTMAEDKQAEEARKAEERME